MKFINLTKHSITEVTTGMVIPRSGRIARIKCTTPKVAEHAGVPIYLSSFGTIEGLPAPEKDVMYIVSSLSLNGIPEDRTDVVAPGNLQRDENGIAIGCVGFRRK